MEVTLGCFPNQWEWRMKAYKMCSYISSLNIFFLFEGLPFIESSELTKVGLTMSYVASRPNTFNCLEKRFQLLYNFHERILWLQTTNINFSLAFWLFMNVFPGSYNSKNGLALFIGFILYSLSRHAWLFFFYLPSYLRPNFLYYYLRVWRRGQHGTWASGILCSFL